MELILNLEPKFVEKYWKDKDEKFSKFLDGASKLETWTLINSHNTVFKSKLKEFTEIAKDFPTIEWSKNHKEVTELMSQLSLPQFTYLIHYLDHNFPGLSFHFIIEAIHGKNFKAAKILIRRLTLIKESNYLRLIFTPMRTRLISGLLDND